MLCGGRAWGRVGSPSLAPVSANLGRTLGRHGKTRYLGNARWCDRASPFARVVLPAPFGPTMSTEKPVGRNTRPNTRPKDRPIIDHARIPRNLLAARPRRARRISSASGGTPSQIAVARSIAMRGPNIEPRADVMADRSTCESDRMCSHSTGSAIRFVMRFEVRYAALVASSGMPAPGNANTVGNP
jgi:hypothetical protein